jgi:hypothetical protein
MLLSPEDAALFFKLHRALMFFVNQRLRVIPGNLASPEDFAALAPEARLKVRDAFLKHTDLMQSFVDENPVHRQMRNLSSFAPGSILFTAGSTFSVN